MEILDELASRHCTPMRGPEHRLTAAVIGEMLAGLPGWSVIEEGAAIGKTFRFADYHHTMAFVNALAWVAHREDHHPDLGVHYDRVIVRFSTHDVGGISSNDLICAARLEKLSS